MGIDIVCGFILDYFVGDPAWMPHPIRAIGKLIEFLEKAIRSLSLGEKGLKVAGVFLLVITVGISYLVTALILHYALELSSYVFLIVSTILIYFELATGCLTKEAYSIHDSLEERDLEIAREKLSMIVGRDTENLSKMDIIRATVETIAENVVDGIISPLFYIVIGGPALGMAYKAVNTLDSMVGYKNEKYKDLGWASAKFDDIVNWIPARLTGILIPVAGGLWDRKTTKRAMQIHKRDKSKHTSPNAGHPEAAMAGVLGVQLGGDSTYGGIKIEKPLIGDAIKPLEIKHIMDSVTVMKTTAILTLILFLAFAVRLGHL